MDEKIELIVGDYNLSSWSMRAWLAAKISGLDIKVIPIRLDTPQTAKQIKKYSPSGRVPVLHHGKLRIWDSLAICEYLAEIAPNKSMWPKGRSARAEARSYVCEMHSGFASLRAQLSMDVNLRMNINHLTGATIEDIRRICQLWENALVKYQGEYLFGEFSIVDVYYAPVVMRFLSYGIQIKSKKINRYIKTLQSHPVIVEWLKLAKKEKPYRIQF